MKRAPGLLRADTREALLETSALSREEERMVPDGAVHVFSELLNAEVEAARLGQQGDADFTSLERRGESLYQLAATVEQKLGPYASGGTKALSGC